MDRNPSDFESDRKWCPTCETYVPYLMSYESSYCVECGGEVRLFSRADWETFSETMQARRPKSRRAGRDQKRRGTA
ncbi:MAG: hypothetical protein AAFZ87_04425 [Planctomycetota bacterium]